MASTTLFRAISTILCGACASLLWNDLSRAHGFAGKRFFPATLVIEDPFVADELSLPTISYRKFPANGDETATNETDFAVCRGCGLVMQAPQPALAALLSFYPDDYRPHVSGTAAARTPEGSRHLRAPTSAPSRVARV